MHITIDLPRGLTPEATLVVNLAAVAKIIMLNGSVLYMPPNIQSVEGLQTNSMGVLADMDGDVDG